MKLESLFGWALLILGVFIILWSLYNLYQVFLGKSPLPELIRAEEKAQKVPQKIVKDLEAMIEQKISQAIEKIFPSEKASKFLNFLALSAFYGVFIFGGGQIGSLGIKLLKK